MIDSAKLPITGPCPIDLDAIGFDRGAKNAHCTHCSKRVHNLSRMSETEARAFLADNAGSRMCVSYAKGSDGKIKFKPPEPVGAAIIPSKHLVRRAPARVPAVAAAGLAAALAACTPVEHPDHRQDVAGAIVAPRSNVTVQEPETIVAGEAPIEVPPPEHVLTGKIAVPQPVEVVDGDMLVPEPADLDEPCDRTNKPATPKDPTAKREHRRPGKMERL